MDLSSAGIAAVPESFWRHLAGAPTALLLLDYDGTLAPFRVERQRAEPYPGVRERLSNLLQHSRTRLVIISGRPTADVIRLLGISPGPEVWGMHGFERRHPNGRLEREELPSGGRVILEEAMQRGEARLSPERVERKGAAAAFHWRGLPDREIEAIRQGLETSLAALVAGSTMELHPFDGGLEVRPRGVDKGRAIERLVEEEGEEAAVAYLGDDRTDEDAFEALGLQGLSVLIGC